MPYNDPNKFYADYAEAALKHVTAKYEEVSCENAWFLYNETIRLKAVGVELDGQPTQFIGRLVGDYDDYIELYKANGITLPPEMVGISKPEMTSLKTLDGYLEGRMWNVTVNDAWLLAGVNSLQQFRACSPITWDNILSEKHGVKVTGRELIGLALAGYSEKAFADGSKVYVYTLGSEKKAEDLTFAEYDSAVSSLKDDKQVKGWFASNSKFVIG